MAKILIMVARECLKRRNTYVVCDKGLLKYGKNTNYVSQGMLSYGVAIHVHVDMEI